MCRTKMPDLPYSMTMVTRFFSSSAMRSQLFFLS